MGRLTKEEEKRRDELLAKGLKVCGKCGRVLPVEQFSKDKSKKDGLNSKCKECVAQYYQENKEKIQQYDKQYKEEHKEDRLQYNKQYYQENREEILQYMQQYYQENKEERQQYDKQYKQQYYQENKEKIQQYYQQYYQTPEGQIAYFNANAKRREREENQGAGITSEQWLEMMQFFDWKCAYSDISLNKNNRSIDHIVPLTKGGENEVWNCVPMDKSLNSSKRDTDMMEWYTAQDFYSKERLDKIKAWQQYAFNKWSNREQNIKIKEI